MTYSAQQGDVEISRLHNVAVCMEIGERLAIEMKPKSSGIPLRLLMLMRQLREEPSGRLAGITTPVIALR